MGMPITAPRFTLHDLDALPDDGNRYELLDGMLLVTPPPRHAHQLIASRFQLLLSEAVVKTGEGNVVGPGAIRVEPATQLEPDILVYPARFGSDAAWEDISRHWLAVEILSRSSRIYDREFKRGAYLAMGVTEVWLVDIDTKSVEVCWNGGTKVVQDTIRWHVPDIDRIVAIELPEIFS